MKLALTNLILLVHLVVYSQDSRTLTDSLEKALKSSVHDTTKIKLLNELSEVCEIDQILTYTDPLIKLCEQNLSNENNSASLSKFYLKYNSDALINSGYYFKQKGEILEALNYYEKSLNIKQQIGDKSGASLALNNIAMIYYNQGNITKALAYHTQSLKIQEELGNKSGIANSLNNIGGIYDNQGDTHKALEYFSKSLKLREELGDKAGVATSLTNIGYIYLNRGDTNKALEYCNKTLQINKEINNQSGLAYAFNNLGFIYLNQGNIDKAFEFYNKSLKIRERIGDKQGQAYSYNNLAAVFYKQKNYENAIKYATLSLKISEELGFPNSIRDAALSLKNSYDKSNMPAKALKMYELYIQMRDSIANIETKKASFKTQFRYEFDKKEALLKEEQSKENLIAQGKSQRQKIFIWWVLSGLILLLIFSLIVFNRLQITRKQKIIIEEQKHLVEEHQKDILASINYAKRIQFALLASDTLLNTGLPEHFVLFKPKDVVSGDFYWACPSPEGFIYITADCTGHGVPGAFMSLLNISKLSQTINENKIYRPDHILNNVRQEIIKVLNPHGSAEESKDGMDAVLCKLDVKNMKLEYAAANNSFYIIRDKTLLICKADKMPVGKGYDDSISFSYNEITLEKGDIIYTFTDGFADQFGGPLGKKYKYKAFENLLLSIHHENLAKQKELILQSFNAWKGELEQVDDVCILAIKV